MSSGYYDAAQICRNGHVITSFLNDSPEVAQKFCTTCGVETITACDGCKAPIRGNYEVPGIAFVGRYQRPSYCPHCGQPYPWTITKLQAAKDLVAELEELTPEERTQLDQTLDDLVRESPKTELAGFRFKKLMKKVGRESYDAVKSVVTDLVSETVKKTLFGG
jgi:hypothetical protein